jgi:hypothetical protein
MRKFKDGDVFSYYYPTIPARTQEDVDRTRAGLPSNVAFVDYPHKEFPAHTDYITIEWDEKYQAWGIPRDYDWLPDFEGWKYVGNIYKNPELLEKGKNINGFKAGSAVTSCGGS